MKFATVSTTLALAAALATAAETGDKNIQLVQNGYAIDCNVNSGVCKVSCAEGASSCKLSAAKEVNINQADATGGLGDIINQLLQAVQNLLSGLTGSL